MSKHDDELEALAGVDTSVNLINGLLFWRSLFLASQWLG